MTNNREIVDLDNDFIVIAVPSSALEIDITAKVWYNGDVLTVGRTMCFYEIREAFKEAQAGYIPQDAVFVLNKDLSKNKLERLVSRCLDETKEYDNIWDMNIKDFEDYEVNKGEN